MSDPAVRLAYAGVPQLAVLPIPLVDEASGLLGDRARRSDDRAAIHIGEAHRCGGRGKDRTQHREGLCISYIYKGRVGVEKGRQPVSHGQ